MSDEHLHPKPPADLPPEEHNAALNLEEAKRLENLKASVCASHRTAGSEELPKVHPEEVSG